MLKSWSSQEEGPLPGSLGEKETAVLAKAIGVGSGLSCLPRSGEVESGLGSNITISCLSLPNFHMYFLE